MLDTQLLLCLSNCPGGFYWHPVHCTLKIIGKFILDFNTTKDITYTFFFLGGGVHFLAIHRIFR